MKTKLFLLVLEVLKKNPTLKKYFGEILLRLVAPTSPFFRPLTYLSAVLSVLSAVAVVVKDELVKAGFALPGWFTIAVLCIGSASTAIAFVGSFTADQASIELINKKTA